MAARMPAVWGADVMRSLPARYPEHGSWPLEMPADIAAACLGYRTTGELRKAVLRKEAPQPSASRLGKGRREPVWALDICRAHIARRHEIKNDASQETEDIGSLV